MAGKQTQYSILHWDSRLFGYTVARLRENCDREHLQRILHELKNLHIRLVYWFVDPSDVERKKAAVKNGGKLVDEKVTYTLGITDIKGSRRCIVGVSVYRQKNLTKELREMALQCGVFSRFAVDKNFVHNEYVKLYTIWMKKSVQRSIAFTVLVYRDVHNKVRGVITLERKGDAGHIGLFVVDRKFRGKSIGKNLMQEALRIFARRGFRKVLVTTQGKNVKARAFYEKSGFTVLKSQHIYHFWL